MVPVSAMTSAETGQQSASLTAGMAQVRRRRARAAVVMIVASLSIGFLLGRGSTWVVPLGNSEVSVVDRQPAVAAGAGSSTVVSRALSPGIGAADPNSAKTGGDALEASATGFGVLVWASRPAAMRESTERTEPDVAILNRGSGNDEVPVRPEIVDSGASDWLKHAENARRLAADMTHRAAKREMLNIAEAYRRLAACQG